MQKVAIGLLFFSGLIVASCSQEASGVSQEYASDVDDANFVIVAACDLIPAVGAGKDLEEEFTTIFQTQYDSASKMLAQLEQALDRNRSPDPRAYQVRRVFQDLVSIFRKLLSVIVQPPLRERSDQTATAGSGGAARPLRR